MLSSITTAKPADIAPERSLEGCRQTRSPPVSAVSGATTAEARLQAALDSLAAAEARLRLCERQLVELNHRIANTLQIASGLIRAQRSRLADPSAKRC